MSDILSSKVTVTIRHACGAEEDYRVKLRDGRLPEQIRVRSDHDHGAADFRDLDFRLSQREPPVYVQIVD